MALGIIVIVIVVIGAVAFLTATACEISDSIVGKILSILGGVIITATLAVIFLVSCKKRIDDRNSDRTVTVRSGGAIVAVYDGTGIDVWAARDGSVEITLPDGREYVYYNSDVECVVNDSTGTDTDIDE